MKDFFRQLQERHVVKVAIAYLVAAWVVLQLADVILPAMNLPEWTITLTLGLLAGGFPIALVLAWVFDITPEGLQKTNDMAGSPAVAQEAGENTHQHSLAVLPFPDMSAEKDQEYFCDGLTDELLNVLTRIPNLRVASRTSCFAFKGKETNMAEVAEKLQVGHVLEGSVRKDGNRIRVMAQLVEVASDTRLWSETYDRELCDIFAIQDEIAGCILEVLKIRLRTDHLHDPTTQSAKAFEYFLRGKGYGITRSEQGVQRAIELFQKAVAEDPGFVRAWIALAEFAAIQTLFLGGGEASCDIACDAADRAMDISPCRADSFMARGFSHLAAHRYQQAEQDFHEALKLNEHQVNAWHYLARAAHHQGHNERSVAYFLRATELDEEDWESPLLAISNYYRLGDKKAARRMAEIGVKRVKRHLEDYPDNPRAYYLGLGGLEALGQLDLARQWAEQALELSPDDPPTRYNMACFYARMGETEKALDLLEGSIRSRSWIENDPDMDSLRDSPRYKAIIQSLRN